MAWTEKSRFYLFSDIRLRKELFLLTSWASQRLGWQLNGRFFGCFKSWFYGWFVRLRLGTINKLIFDVTIPILHRKRKERRFIVKDMSRILFHSLTLRPIEFFLGSLEVDDGLKSNIRIFNHSFIKRDEFEIRMIRDSSINNKNKKKWLV